MSVRIDGKAATDVFDVTGELCRGTLRAAAAPVEGRAHVFRRSSQLPLRAAGAAPLPASRSSRPQGRRRNDAAAERRGARAGLDRFELEGPFRIDPREPSLESVETRRRILFARRARTARSPSARREF